MKEVKRYLFLLVGLISIGFGASLFLEGNIGADGFNVFNQAVGIKLDMMPGTVNIIISVFYLICILIFIPSYRKLGIVISTFALGTIVNMFIMVLGFLNIPEWPFLIRCVVTLIGCNFAALGIAIGYVSQAGMHPNDIIPILIADKIKTNYKVVRICYDLLYTFIGVLLGGIAGLGTIFTILLIGPISKKYMEVLGDRIKFE